jgi:hypothetical protein
VLALKLSNGFFFFLFWIWGMVFKFAANPEARKLDGYLFNERLKKIDLGQWNRDQANREKVFEKFRSFF